MAIVPVGQLRPPASIDAQPENAVESALPTAESLQKLTDKDRSTGLGRAVSVLLHRGVLNQYALGLADQAIVSAISFVALILIARWSDASQLGTYAIGMSVLALLLATQESLVTRPYAIQMHRPPGAPAEHAFSSLLQSLLLSVGGAFLVGGTGLILWTSGARPEFVAMAWALAIAIPFVLLREFARKYCFAHLRTLQALVVDIGIAAISIMLLVGLGWTGGLSAATGFYVLAISCAIGIAGWLYLARREFALSFRHVQIIMKQSWDLGKWLLSGQIAMQVQGYMTYWLALVLGGAAVTGIYAACMSIVALANPILFGFYNILTPKFVRALHDGGSYGLRRMAVRDAALLGVIMTVFCVTIYAFGAEIMDLLYPGPEYQDHAASLTVLSVAALAAAVGVPASLALASAERPRPVAFVTGLAALLTVLLVWQFMSRWGLLGAAYGLLIAEMVGSLGRWAAFLTMMPAVEPHDSKQPSFASAPQSTAPSTD